MGGVDAGYWFGVAALAVCLLSFVLLLSWEAFAARFPYRDDGTPRERGLRRRSAFMSTRGHGTPTPGTATTEGCSFYSARGTAWEDGFAQTAHRLGNSYSGRGLYTGGTATRGANGERPEGAA